MTSPPFKPMKARVLFVSVEGLLVIASKNKKKISNDRTLFLKAVGKNHISKGICKNTVQYNWVWLFSHSKNVCCVLSVPGSVTAMMLQHLTGGDTVLCHPEATKGGSWFLPRAPPHSCSALRDAVCHHSVPASSFHICPSKAHSADLEQIICLCKDLHSPTGPDWGGDEREERGNSTSLLFNPLHMQHGLECHAPPHSCQSNGLQFGHSHEPTWRWGVGCVMGQSLQNTALTPEFWISTGHPWFFNKLFCSHFRCLWLLLGSVSGSIWRNSGWKCFLTAQSHINWIVVQLHFSKVFFLKGYFKTLFPHLGLPYFKRPHRKICCQFTV